MRSAKLRVQLIGRTHFQPPEDVPWSTDAEGGAALAEFAGRACYQSWSKPNPATATNAGYLQHILEVGHLSVLEHGTATFYLTGVSRSFTHELVRHRHLSYSQLSQRYVPEGDAMMVEPDVIAGDQIAHSWFEHAASEAIGAYVALAGRLEERLHRQAQAQGAAAPHRHRACGSPVQFTSDPYAYRCPACQSSWIIPGVRTPDDVIAREIDLAPVPTAVKKAARQAARAVLPNATETRIVVTGNYRAWRHFIGMRATEHADVEIRRVAIAVLRRLQEHVPQVFGDYTISVLEDGSEVADSPFRHID